MNFKCFVAMALCGCVVDPTESEPNTTGSSVVVGSLPIIPAINGAVGMRVQEILSSPAAATNRRNVFAKVGDSITESASFLKDNGCVLPPETVYFGSHADLVPVVNRFTALRLPVGYTDAWCGVPNSFTRASHVAMSGMTSNFAFSATTLCAAPNNTRLRCEYELMRPAYALVMFGTNDVLANVDRPIADALATYTANMQAIIDQSIAMGVVPVVSTIPPLVVSTSVTAAQTVRVNDYNQVIADLAISNNIPLWNYHRAMTELGAINNFGISNDGIHPSIYHGSSAGIFLDEALKFGYNVRNLNAIQVLGALDAATSAPSTSIVWNTTVLPPATVGQAYAASVSANGSPSPTYSATGLPPGLTVDAVSGLISGTPTTSGTFSVTMTASSGQLTSVATVDLTVNAVVLTTQAPTITTNTLPVATQGVAYSTAIAVTAAPAAVIEVTGLPNGLTLNTTSGVISGTPTVSGMFTLTLQARNGILPDASRTIVLSVAVRSAPVFTNGNPPSGNRNRAYSFTLTASGTPVPTFSANRLPRGLFLNSVTGLISGTPTRTGSVDCTFTATNGALPTAMRTYTFVIR
jgi:hypothetical protein